MENPNTERKLPNPVSDTKYFIKSFISKNPVEPPKRNRTSNFTAQSQRENQQNSSVHAKRSKFSGVSTKSPDSLEAKISQHGSISTDYTVAESELCITCSCETELRVSRVSNSHKNTDDSVQGFDISDQNIENHDKNTEYYGEGCEGSDQNIEYNDQGLEASVQGFKSPDIKSEGVKFYEQNTDFYEGANTSEQATTVRSYSSRIPKREFESEPSRARNNDESDQGSSEFQSGTEMKCRPGGHVSSRTNYGRRNHFDICPERGIHIELVDSFSEAHEVSNLMPGMVLLKNWLNKQNQVDIVTKCRDLGKGEGGFYQPEFGSGNYRRKMHLRMMCLGRDWDPEEKVYSDRRKYDGAIPPRIPDFLLELCRDANVHARENEIDYLPICEPDICIVNFYEAEWGRLGMHKDKDESTKSIDAGLPVVSFSLGDSAEFTYGMTRDIHEKVTLESGDVLIFGGKSRLVYHGVSKVNANTTPKWLADATGLKPGSRLNLTFRQY